MVKLVGRYFRGFERIEVDLDGVNFVLGDNSSGKSSLLHFIDCVLRDDLNEVPRLSSELGVGEFDYFSKVFNNRDVTLGYCDVDEVGKWQGKFISLRKRTNDIPLVVRTSYFWEGSLLTLRLEEGVLSERRVSLENGNYNVALDVHLNDENFFKVDSVVDAGAIPKGMSLAFPGYFLFLRHSSSNTEQAEPNEELVDENHFLKFAMGGVDLPSSTFLGPLRSMPEKYYEKTRRLSPSGAHFASMWSGLPIAKRSKNWRSIKKFGKESGLFDGIKVQPISSEIEDAPLLVYVLRNGHSFLLNQVGVGVSQVAPILVETLYASAMEHKRVALFQQPELHLHPVAQAALGTFFAGMAAKRFMAFLETHSNFMIDRFRAEWKSMKSHPEKARVLFCVAGAEGNEVIVCDINDDGQIVGAPDAYYDFFLSESIRTLL